MKLLLIILTVLSSFLTNLETRTLQSDFTITVSEEVNAPMNYPGSLTMCGQSFLLKMFNLEAAYDGKTLYMYSPEIDELTLSNPTEQELVEANPFLYAKALVGVCNVVERPSSDGKQTIVTLTPKDRSIGIDRFTLRVRNEDLLPLSIEIKEGKKTSILKLKEPKFEVQGDKVQVTKYTILPGTNTYVNDLRL